MSAYTADHTDVLKGVDALIHCGSPTVFRGETVQDLVNVRPIIHIPPKPEAHNPQGTCHGIIKLVETAIMLGIKMIVFSSTLAALLKRDQAIYLWIKWDDSGTLASIKYSPLF